MTYQPSIPDIQETTVSEDSYDPAIEKLTNEEIIAFVNEAVAGLETDDILLSGNFSSGWAESATISTKSPELVYWRASDVGVSLVLASEKESGRSTPSSLSIANKTWTPGSSMTAWPGCLTFTGPGRKSVSLKAPAGWFWDRPPPPNI